MRPDVSSWGGLLDWLGVTGLVAIIMGAVGYGRMHNRVTSLEQSIEKQEEHNREAREQSKMLARVDERTHALSEDMKVVMRYLRGESK